MRRTSALLLLGFLAGCSTQSTQPDANPKRTDSKDTRTVHSSNAHIPAPTAGRAIRLDHDSEAAYRARHFYLQGVRLIQAEPPRVDEAIREFQIALEHDPLYYKAHFKLGYCYYYKGQYALEIAEYKKCLAINPDYLPAWLNLGHAHLAKDELKEARRSYLRVLDRKPDHQVALYNLGLVEFDLREYEASKSRLEQFMRHDAKQTAQRKHAETVLDRIRERLAGKGVGQ